jgi:hypothetical protein
MATEVGGRHVLWLERTPMAREVLDNLVLL